MMPGCIDALGDVVGHYTTDNGPYRSTHSFIRKPDGTITTFDLPSTNPTDSLYASTVIFNIDAHGWFVGIHNGPPR